MHKHITRLAVMISLATITSRASAQAGGGESKDYSTSPIVTRMMAFDKNKDGKLTRDEITDERLLRLFDQADANKDGVVTHEELSALAAKLDEDAPRDRGGPGGPGGFDGGPGGPRGPGLRGRGGPGGFGGSPQPGQVLPLMLQDMLELTDEQKKQVADLQKDVDARLAKILTDQQMSRLKQMRQRGPRGPGGRGGPEGAPPPPPPPPDGQ